MHHLGQVQTANLDVKLAVGQPTRHDVLVKDRHGIGASAKEGGVAEGKDTGIADQQVIAHGIRPPG